MSEPFTELSKDALAKLTKDERKAYHQRRVAAQQPQKKQQLTKEERRNVNQANVQKKDEAKADGAEEKERLEELKLQGLSEEDAIEVMKQEAAAARELAADDDGDDGDEADDLLSTVRKYIMTQNEVMAQEDAVHDFNLKVRFQGHVESTPPDHIACVLQVLFAEVVTKVDVSNVKLQPAAVAKAAEAILQKWSSLLAGLYSKIDVMEAAGIVVKVAHEAAADKPAAAVAAVGCLMGIQEVDVMEDQDLQIACKGFEPVSKVLAGFIEFLNDDDDSSEEDA